MSVSLQLSILASLALSMGLDPRVGVPPNLIPPKEILLFGMVWFLT